MAKKSQFFFICSVVLLLSGCSPAEKPLYSGLVEGAEVPVLSEIGGSVEKLNAEEGQAVKKGEILATLDQRMLQQQTLEAQAALELAAAALEEAQEGTREQELSKAEYLVEQFESQVASLLSQELKLEANVEQKEAMLEQAESQWNGAQSTWAYQKEKLADLQRLVEAGAESVNRLEEQEEAVRQAQVNADQLLSQLKSMEAQKTMADRELASMEAQIQSAQSQKKSALAALDLLQEGVTSHKLKQLMAQKKAAQARLEQSRIQMSKALIESPADGIIIRRNVALGEIVKPSFQLLTLLEDGKLEVHVYIPEAQLNQVSIGTEAMITVDAYPGESFEGKVKLISEKSMFTPKNVQTADERTKMVFRVTIQVETGWGKLKPGMPADVRFLGGEAP